MYSNMNTITLYFEKCSEYIYEYVVLLGKVFDYEYKYNKMYSLFEYHPILNSAAHCPSSKALYRTLRFIVYYDIQALRFQSDCSFMYLYSYLNTSQEIQRIHI